MARDETTPRHRRFGCFILPLAAIIGVVLGLCNLSYKSSYVAPGIYPAPDTSFIGRRTQVHLLREKADTAVIFIGGFGDQTTANFRCVYEGMPPLPGCGKQVRAYYAWDGAEGSLFEHSTAGIQQDITAFLELNPGANLIFIGHSYGGSATMDIIRNLKLRPENATIVVTLDAVSCRERSCPRERAPEVDFWINSYCAPYRTAGDIVPKLGGPWRHCEQADVNLCFSGKERASDGRRYQHKRPYPLFMDAYGSGSSAYALLQNVCRSIICIPLED